MKTSLVIAFFGLATVAHAQEWSGGVGLDLPLNIDRTGTTFQSGATTFDMSSGLEANKLRPTVFVRYDRPAWLLQADVQHVANFGIGFRATGAAQSSSEGAKGTQTALRLSGGYKPAPWLRLQAGVGVAYTAWNATNYTAYADVLEAQIRQGQSNRTLQEQLTFNRDVARVIDSYQPIHLTGQVGIGVDLGGLTLDLLRTQSLTPALNGVAGTSETARQHYGYYSLRVGYRLFPLKKFLLATRQNKAYEKLKAEIPFYKNEFQVGLGILGEDIGTGLVYENRYTRYVTRRFGLTGVLGAARTSYSRPDDPNRLKAFTAFHGAVMARVLPLYTRRHQIGVSAGVNVLSVTPRYAISTAYQYKDAQVTVTYGSVSARPARAGIGWQWQVDYQVALTDRIPLGLWLRGSENPALSYAYFGIQSGYRF